MEPPIAPMTSSPRVLNSRFDRTVRIVEKTASVPFPLKVIALTLFVPVELSFFVFGLRFTLIRLIFLALVPVLLIKFARKVSSNRYRFVFSDIAIVLTGFWFIYAPANVDDLAQALNHAGPDVLEFCIGYMATRILLSEHGDAVFFVNLLGQVIAIVALIALLDPLMGHYVVHDLGRQLSGYAPNYGQYDYRLGLLRASGPIEHPIWFGFICGIGLLIAVSVPIRRRSFVLISCSLGAFFALSSAPIQSIIFGLTLLGYNRIASRVRFRWLFLLVIGAAGIIAAFLLSNSPIGFIISHLIYDPESGYYRYWTWDRVMFYVAESPWYGLGYGQLPDEIDHSIDSLWLVLAIHSGVPGALLFASSMIGAASLPTTGTKIDLTLAESKLGTSLGILIFLTLYLAFTVHIPGILWILTGLLIGVRAHLGELGHLRPRDTRATRGMAHHRA